MKITRIFFRILLLVLSACELLLSWKVRGFSDFYVKYIFPIFGATYGRLTGLFKISIGEILLYAAVIYTVITILLWMSRFVAFVDGKERFKAVNKYNSRFFFGLLIFVVVVQVQNCFVLYHTTPLYEETEIAEYEPSREDLIALREMLVIKANELSEVFDRNSKGEIIYDADLKSIAKITMQGVGEGAKRRLNTADEGYLDQKLSLLAGYYSAPKPFLKSDFFSQQYIKGYYFPFSLEANYNNLMYIANMPDTMCHELSHLKGFIFEDEASFLAYIGCINSNDSLFIYSGTLNALAYVNEELRLELALEPEIRKTLTPVSDKVYFDSVFLTEEAWDAVEADAILDTEKVSEASETFLDTNLTVNGVEDGIVSYSRIVELLLKYYFGEEYVNS